MFSYSGHMKSDPRLGEGNNQWLLSVLYYYLDKYNKYNNKNEKLIRNNSNKLI